MSEITGSLQTQKDRPNYFAVLNFPAEDGKRVKQKWVSTGIPVKGDNKRRAKARLEEILAEYNKGGVDVLRDDCFMRFMEQWLETLRLAISPATYDTYKNVLDAHITPFFKPKRLKVKEVTPAVMQRYVNEKLASGLSPNTVKRHLANLSKCLDSAVKQNIIAFNPVSRIEKPRAQKFTGAKFYNEKQIEQLFEASKGDPLEVLILLTVFYGLRRSEVLGLKWDAIDFEEKIITIKHTIIRTNQNIHRLDRTKNDASHAVLPMPSKIAQKLLERKREQEEHKALQPNDYIDEGYVFTKPNGELFSPSYVSKHFQIILKNNGLPSIRFHDLRHSSASFLHHLGFDLKEIQVWLRHKDIQTTMNLYLLLY